MSRGGLPGSEHRCDPGSFFAPPPNVALLGRAAQDAIVVANRRLCREHYRLTLRLCALGPARPGQFVHLCPTTGGTESGPTNGHSERGEALNPWIRAFTVPMLRRAFSIAGLRRGNGDVEVDVIYRVVGTASRWMESLRMDDVVSLLGPLGNAFPISVSKSQAWLVAGGVGLPPMLWLAEALHAAHKNAVAFCGAQRAELLALTVDAGCPPDRTAARATASVQEFVRHGAPVVISTDDGSLGFRGYVGSAMAAHFEMSRPGVDDVVVYTCGPEPMMRYVAEFCIARNMECYVCVERNMACGTGMCQSCVVPVRDTRDPEGWSYRLCCTDGPIFEARNILWDT